MHRTAAPLAPRLSLFLALLVLPACGDGGAPAGATAGSGGRSGGSGAHRIAVVPKGTTHSYWTKVERGAREAESQLGVEVVWKAQLDEGDRAGQIAVVQQLVGSGVDALCIAPLDAKGLARTVEDVVSKGVPVVVFDSMLDGEPGVDFAGYVGTDNEAAGRLAGETLAELLGGEGDVVLLRYLVGSASTEARERGFLQAIAERPGMQVLVSDRYAGATSAGAQSEALAMLPMLRRAKGVFCSNEPTTAGMLLALRREKLLDDLVFVGFDSSTPLIEGLERGEIDALVVQDPVGMGREAVRLAQTLLEGGTIPPVTDTGAVVVRAADLADPDVRALVE
ncbi:MAG: substrate-binding domain-containing protein [Planctomycetota bacterium]